MWETPTRHNKDASQIKDICKETQGKQMDDIVITTEMIKRQVKAVNNWSAPGPEELHRFWLKHLTSLHQHIAV